MRKQDYEAVAQAVKKCRLATYSDAFLTGNGDRGAVFHTLAEDLADIFIEANAAVRNSQFTPEREAQFHRAVFPHQVAYKDTV
jgi:hypothetical protein